MFSSYPRFWHVTVDPCTVTMQVVASRWQVSWTRSWYGVHGKMDWCTPKISQVVFSIIEIWMIWEAKQLMLEAEAKVPRTPSTNCTMRTSCWPLRICEAKMEDLDKMTSEKMCRCPSFMWLDSVAIPLAGNMWFVGRCLPRRSKLIETGHTWFWAGVLSSWRLGSCLMQIIGVYIYIYTSYMSRIYIYTYAYINVFICM